MAVRLQPVLVETGTRDEEARLVFVDDRLVAVLVLLSDAHEDVAGQWFLEHGFGRLNAHLTFPDLDAATAWITGHCSRATELVGTGRSR